MLDMWLLQWPVVKCCKVVVSSQRYDSTLCLTLLMSDRRCTPVQSRGVCIENVLGLVQVTLQWFLFTVMCVYSCHARPHLKANPAYPFSSSLILYLIYFPHHLKYQRTLPLPDDPILTSPTSPTSPRSPRLTGRAGIGSEETPLLNGASRGYVIDQDPDTVNVAKMVKIEGTQEWRLAVTLAWVVFIHLFVSLLSSIQQVLAEYRENRQHHLDSNHRAVHRLFPLHPSSNNDNHVHTLPVFLLTRCLPIRTSANSNVQT